MNIQEPLTWIDDNLSDIIDVEDIKVTKLGDKFCLNLRYAESKTSIDGESIKQVQSIPGCKLDRIWFDKGSPMFWLIFEINS